MTSAKNKLKKNFLYFFKNYLLKVMSVKCFSSTRLVDEKWLGGGRGAGCNFNSLVRNRVNVNLILPFLLLLLQCLCSPSNQILCALDCSWTRTQNHLVCKRILNHLAKLACFFGRFLCFPSSFSLFHILGPTK